MMQLTQIMMQLRRKDMKKIILAVLATAVFGKMFPLIIVAVLLAGLAVIIKEAAEHGNT